MTYAEMQQAEAEYLKAIEPQPKKQRRASKTQLEYRAQRFGTGGRPLAALINDGSFAVRR